jgi:hypothetical protein
MNRTAVSEAGNAELAKLLSRRAADLNARANDGTTALMMASAQGQASVVEVLLQNGAEVNPRNEDKITALHLACEAGHLAAARRLLQGGANTADQDRYGKTPSGIASIRGHSNVRKLLAKPTERSRTGFWSNSGSSHRSKSKYVKPDSGLDSCLLMGAPLNKALKAFFGSIGRFHRSSFRTKGPRSLLIEFLIKTKSSVRFLSKASV